jgi:hypothetical protein
MPNERSPSPSDIGLRPGTVNVVQIMCAEPVTTVIDPQSATALAETTSESASKEDDAKTLRASSNSTTLRFRWVRALIKSLSRDIGVSLDKTR